MWRWPNEHTGTQPAREAANMVDLDSNPTKLIEVVEIGSKLLMTRGCTDHVQHRKRCNRNISPIIPAAFASTYPILNAAQHHAVDDAAKRVPIGMIFNALFIMRLSHGVTRRTLPAPVGAARLLPTIYDLWRGRV